MEKWIKTKLKRVWLVFGGGVLAAAFMLIITYARTQRNSGLINLPLFNALPDLAGALLVVVSVGALVPEFQQRITGKIRVWLFVMLAAIGILGVISGAIQRDRDKRYAQEQTEAIRALAQWNLDEQTGGSSYPLAIVGFGSIDAPNQFPLIISIQGEHALTDLQYSVMVGFPPYIPTPDQIRDMLSGRKPQYVYLGTLSKTLARLVTSVTPSPVAVTHYLIQTFTKYKAFHEELEVRFNVHNRWEQRWKVLTDKDAVVDGKNWTWPQ